MNEHKEETASIIKIRRHSYYAVAQQLGKCVPVRKSNRLTNSKKIEEERAHLAKKHGEVFGRTCVFVPGRTFDELLISMTSINEMGVSL